MRRLAIAAVCVAVVMVAIAGCKSQPKFSKTPITGTYEEPQWVTKVASAFPEDAGKALYGLGISEWKHVPSESKQRVSALAGARRDIADQMETFVQAVYKDYSRFAFTPSTDVAESERLVEDVVKTITDQNVMGAAQVDSWRHPGTKNFYVLVKVDMNSIAQRLKQKIVAVEKERLIINAEKAHKELDVIIEKNRERMKP